MLQNHALCLILYLDSDILRQKIILGSIYNRLIDNFPYHLYVLYNVWSVFFINKIFILKTCVFVTNLIFKRLYFKINIRGGSIMPKSDYIWLPGSSSRVTPVGFISFSCNFDAFFSQRYCYLNISPLEKTYCVSLFVFLTYQKKKDLDCMKKS